MLFSCDGFWWNARFSAMWMKCLCNVFWALYDAVNYINGSRWFSNLFFWHINKFRWKWEGNVAKYRFSRAIALLHANKVLLRWIFIMTQLILFIKVAAAIYQFLFLKSQLNLYWFSTSYKLRINEFKYTIYYRTIRYVLNSSMQRSSYKNAPRAAPKANPTH